MSNAFFTLVSDALPGFLPESLRDYAHRITARNLKVWFEPERREHYEAQLLGAAPLRAAGLDVDPPALEIGFHAEHKEAARNDAAVSITGWKRTLGPDATAGTFIGRPSPWRRISDVWPAVETDDDGTAIEAAERLGAYITTFEAIRRR